MKNIFCLVGGYTLCSVESIDYGHNMGYFHIQGDVHLPFNRVKYANDKDPHCGNDPYMPCGHGAFKKPSPQCRRSRSQHKKRISVWSRPKSWPLWQSFTRLCKTSVKKKIIFIQMGIGVCFPFFLGYRRIVCGCISPRQRM